MTDLFGRRIRVQVGDLLVEDLSIDFDVKADLTSAPNTARVSIYNLNPDNRNKIAALAEEGAMRVSVGYRTTELEAIFQGDIRRGGSTLEARTWETVIEAADGGRATRRGRVNASHAPGTPIATIMRQVAGSLPGIGSGNLESALRGVTGSTPGTVTVSGSAADSLDRIAGGAGLEWSIQGGALSFTRRAEALAGEFIDLSPEQGLIGSPEQNKDGTITARSYIIPGFIPGRGVILESREISGNFRVRRCNWVGDNRGGSFMIRSILENIDG